MNTAAGLVLLCLLFAGALVFLFRRNRRQAIIEVSLEELSNLWLGYNREMTPVDGPVEAGTDALYASCEDAKESDDALSKKEDVALAGKPLASAGALTDPLMALVEEMRPYERLFREQGAFGLFNALVRELVKHGHCPSVVTDVKDEESADLYTVKDSLARVTLRDHTAAVVRRMIECVKDTYLDFEGRIPMAVVAALAHDLGKIPAVYGSGAYNTSEHPLTGALHLQKLAAPVGGDGIAWLPMAVEAVKEHHRPTKDQFISLLKRADRKAREMELLTFLGDVSLRPIEQWLDTSGFMRLVAPHVNVLRNRKWKAFTHRGIVFCRAELVFDAARSLCRESRVVDMTFVYESERENALRRVVGVLKDRGCIVDALRQGNYTARVELRSAAGRQRFHLVPIKGECFEDMAEFEKRKAGFLETIREVKFL